MPVTDMTRIADAPKRIHELSPEETAESARNARCDDSRINKLKSIFLIVGIVLCVMCGSANQSKAQSTTLSTSSNPYPYPPHYDTFNDAAQSFFNAYYVSPDSTLTWYYLWMGYCEYYYYLANYSGDWYGFNVDTLGNHSDQHLSATSFNPSTASAYWYNYYAYEGDVCYRWAQAVYPSAGP